MFTRNKLHIFSAYTQKTQRNAFSFYTEFPGWFLSVLATVTTLYQWTFSPSSQTKTNDAQLTMLNVNDGIVPVMLSQTHSGQQSSGYGAERQRNTKNVFGQTVLMKRWDKTPQRCQCHSHSKLLSADTEEHSQRTVCSPAGWEGLSERGDSSPSGTAAAGLGAGLLRSALCMKLSGLRFPVLPENGPLLGNMKTSEICTAQFCSHVQPWEW